VETACIVFEIRCGESNRNLKETEYTAEEEEKERGIVL